MADDVDVVVVHRRDDTFRHLPLGLPEPRVNARHHHVEVGKDAVREVDPAVHTDVALGAGEDGDAAAAFAVDPLDLAHLVGQALRGEAAGDMKGLCVVADGDVLVAERRRGLRHLADGVGALAPPGMDVEVAPDRTVADEVGQGPGPGGLDLAAVLPEFRLDPGKAERPVDPGLVLPRDHAVARKIHEPVLVEPPVPRNRESPESDVVLL